MERFRSVAGRLSSAVSAAFTGSGNTNISIKPPPGALEALLELKKLLGVEDSESITTTIRSEIDDIESKPSQTEAEKLRLKNLKKLAFEAENIIADCEREMLRNISGERKRVREAVRSSPSSDDDDDDDEEFDWGVMEDKIRGILLKHKGEKRHQKALKLGKADGKRRKKSEQQRQPTGSLRSDSQIYGRDKNIDEIIDDIINDKRDEIIFPVVGPAGIGKTALVQHVCAHQRVKKYFEGFRFGWVFVRDDFDELMLTKAVYESITGTPSNSDVLDEAQDVLKEELNRQNCLLVLDDVWHSKPEFWSRFWEPLAPNLMGCIVFVITRNFRVLEAMPEKVVKQFDPFIIEPLDYDGSSKLFFSLASIEGHSELKGKAKEIIQKCRGMPFRLKRAAVTFTREYGRKYGDGLQGDFSNLRSSYCRLPARLKRCIAYCSLFPEGHRIQKDFLVKLWIAEGFIQSEDGKELEETGTDYFNELWNQSFFLYSNGKFDMPPNFLPSEEYSRIEYSVTSRAHGHDLGSVRHLSYVVDGQYTDKNGIELKSLADVKTLHTFLIVWPAEDSAKSEFSTLKIDLSALPKMEYLRALDLSCTDLKEVPKSLIKHLRHLHFLSLSGTKIKRLPESICSRLYNLQTLELINCSRLEELPEDTRHMIRLRHLEIPTTLCVPTGIGDLTELQTLQIFNVGRGERFAGIRELKNLRKLKGELCITGLCNVISPFDCQEADLASKEHIEKLILAWPPPHIVDLDHEEFSDNDDDLSSSSEAAMEKNNSEGGQTSKKAPNTDQEEENNKRGRNKMADDRSSKSTEEVSTVNSTSSTIPEENNNITNFKPMVMESSLEESDVNSSSSVVPQENHKVEEILKKLKPHKKLDILVIKSYDGTVFPNWIANDSFEVNKVLLENCTKCVSLPALGLLPYLEYLVVSHMPVKCIGSEFCGPSSKTTKCFPKLLVLKFNELYELHDWTGFTEDDFPRLKIFTSFNCPKLGTIPNFSSLKKLEMENCGALKSLPELPVLKTLRLVACDGLKVLTSFQILRDLTVMYCIGLQDLLKLPSLKNLWLEDCDNLKFVGFLDKTSPSEQKEKLKSFSSLFINNCPPLGFSARKDANKFTYEDDEGIVEERLHEH